MTAASLFAAVTAEGLDFLKNQPYATYSILAIAVGLGLVTNFINIKFMNLAEHRQMMIETKRAQSEMMDATKSGNQRRIDKAQRRQQEVMKLQSKMSMDRMKITFAFFIPFILIWQVLNSFFGTVNIAQLPFELPFFPRDLNVSNWYLLCSFGGNVVVSRILGLTFEIDPEESVVREDDKK